jgi:hypothetical protein
MRSILDMYIKRDEREREREGGGGEREKGR